MKGTVKFFNEQKGFGFIAADDGKEYFVHQSALPEGMRLQENDPVEFDVEDGDRGPKAVNVRLSDGTSEAPAEEAPVEEAAEESTEEEAPAEKEQSAEEETKEEQ